MAFVCVNITPKTNLVVFDFYVNQSFFKAMEIRESEFFCVVLLLLCYYFNYFILLLINCINSFFGDTLYYLKTLSYFCRVLVSI